MAAENPYQRPFLIFEISIPNAFLIFEFAKAKGSHSLHHESPFPYSSACFVLGALLTRPPCFQYLHPHLIRHAQQAHLSPILRHVFLAAVSATV